MSLSYIDPFGGGVIRPSPVAYRSFGVSSSPFQLTWPGYDNSELTSTANKLDISDAIPGAEIRMPPANVVSNGEAVLFTNLSTETVTIATYGGTTIGTCAPGASRLVYLVNNLTAGGLWRTILYGVGTGALDVGSAAGAGLEASGAELQLDWPVEAKVADFTVNSTYRAKMVVWGGGAGTVSFDFASALGNGFAMAVRNQGTGALLLDPAVTDSIDGFSSGFVIQPGDTCFVFSDGAVSLWTVGIFGASSVRFNFTRLSKAITGDVTLTLNEAANVIQEYTGALVGPATITVPATTQVYYVTNSTTGGFALTFDCNLGGTTALVAAGASAVLVCDGTNVRLIAGGGLIASEGTFTPTVLGATTAGVTTYTKQAGTYQRIGSWVHFQLDVRWSAATGTGQLIIDGLPFAAATTPASQAFNTAVLGTTDVFAQGRSGTQMDLFLLSTFGAYAITGTGNVRISGSYLVA